MGFRAKARDAVLSAAGFVRLVLAAIPADGSVDQQRILEVLLHMEEQFEANLKPSPEVLTETVCLVPDPVHPQPQGKTR